MMLDQQKIRELRAEVAETATTDLLDTLIVAQQHAELGQPTPISWWEFRASWQELSRRGYLTAH